LHKKTKLQRPGLNEAIPARQVFVEDNVVEIYQCRTPLVRPHLFENAGREDGEHAGDGGRLRINWG